MQYTWDNNDDNDYDEILIRNLWRYVIENDWKSWSFRKILQIFS